MLQDEKLDYIKQQYDEKNQVLAEFGEEVSPATMYEDIFKDTSMMMPIVMLDDDEKHIVPMTIDEAMEQSAVRNDMLMGGCSYFNNWISKRSARDVYALIVDMDNVYSGVLQNALRQDWRTANDEPLPMPRYIVNSGTGCHLYYQLSEPVPCYHKSTPLLDKVYRALAEQQTTKRVFLVKSVQWFGQDFRMAGGLNKYGWRNTIFRVGETWDIDDLARAVGCNDIHFIRYGEKRDTTEPAPKKKRKAASKGWNTNRAFYDYAVRTCKEKTKEGHRYSSCCALSVIAYKCGVSQEELQSDLRRLIPAFNEGVVNEFREREIYSAMKMYNPKAMQTQRQSLENWQGWEYKPNKRNGRRQPQHLKYARGVKELRETLGEDVAGGRPTAQATVQSWRKLHPSGRKCDCIRDTGLTKPTVLKWWGEDVIEVDMKTINDFTDTVLSHRKFK